MSPTILPHNSGSMDPETLSLRPYQREMYEASLNGNTVVSMETGSGKTMVAIFRIKDFLERGDLGKVVWFTGPTVELCHQQHGAIATMVPTAKTLLLVGADGVDRWSHESIWDDALKGVHVVVSTYAVLLDALSHGFVKIRNIGLLIFDEAHHGTKKHPIKMIMLEHYFYASRTHGMEDIPSILGLTASPAKVWKQDAISGAAWTSTLEQNLDSRCITPREHRVEMHEYVHAPTLKKLEYRAVSGASLCLEAYMEDLSLGIVGNGGGQVPRSPKLVELQEKLCMKVEHLVEELGIWSARQYLDETFQALEAKTDYEYGYFTSSRILKYEFMSMVERLRQKLGRSTENNTELPEYCDKVITLIKYLCECRKAGFSALIFVRRRIVTMMLARILTTHEATKDMLKVGSFVGLSSSTVYSGDLSDIIVKPPNRQILQDFREEKINVIVTTDALEEGIDIVGCNLVVCYEPPQNLKSFIQRRGRARKNASTYTILVSEDQDQLPFKKWKKYEELMLKMIADDTRERARLLEKENHEEDVEDEYRVESTGALVTTSTAKAHLDHFCAKLPPVPYTETKPCYAFEDEGGKIRAEVRLPSSIPGSMRIKSCQTWHTETAAMKDASLQAIKMLHGHGLLSDNLLPLRIEEIINDCFREVRLKCHALPAPHNPWPVLNGETTSKLFRAVISFHGTDSCLPKLVIWTRSALPILPEMRLLAEDENVARVSISKSIDVVVPNKDLLARATEVLVGAARMETVEVDASDALAFITPDLPLNEIQTWINAYEGFKPVMSEGGCSVLEPETVLQHSAREGQLFIFQNWTQLETDPDVGPELECTVISRRRNFLEMRRRKRNNAAATPKTLPENEIDCRTVLLPAQGSFSKSIPLGFVLVSRLLPSIFYQIELNLTAHNLQRTFLTSVRFRNSQDLTAAITSPKTGLASDYNRLEFLGDTVLKFVVSHQLYYEFPEFHEGYLTRKRKTRVSNTPLAKTAIETDLHRSVWLKYVEPKEWIIPCESIARLEQKKPRRVPVKVLGDFTEALIGAAYLGGGLQSAIACMVSLNLAVSENALNPESWAPLSPNDRSIVEKKVPLLASGGIEDMLGYHFKHKYLLLEALTHPSSTRDASTEPYQRLEFFGDAVFDLIVSTALFDLLGDASEGLMTQIKSAVVNRHFLAFLGHRLESSTTDSQAKLTENGIPILESKIQSKRFWSHIIADSLEVYKAGDADNQRFQNIRSDIDELLSRQRRYPWALIYRIGVPKFISDIVESVMGAIYIDSAGDLESCRRFAEKLHLFQYLELLCQKDFNITHPKSLLRFRLREIKPVYKASVGSNGETVDVTIRLSMRALAKVVGCKAPDNETAKMMQIIGQSSNCLSQEEAMVKASEKALAYLDRLERVRKEKSAMSGK